jgi:uncharacterized protein YndB with AHSA1/START domain
MATFTVTEIIAASPEQAWPVLADVVHWPKWLPTMAEVQPLDAPALAIGSRYHITQPKLRPAVWTVTSVSEPHHFTWVTTSRGLRVTAHHRLEAIETSASRLVLEVVIEGWLAPLVALLAGRITRSYLAVEAATFRSRFEPASRR